MKALTEEQQALANQWVAAAYKALYAHNRWVLDYVEEEDACSEVMLTLTRCAQRFDPERGIKFTTYLFNAIRHDLSRLRLRFMKKYNNEKTTLNESVRDPFSFDGATSEIEDTSISDSEYSDVSNDLLALMDLAGLPEHVRDIMFRRARSEQLASIAADYNVSRERIRQIYQWGIDQIKGYVNGEKQVSRKVRRSRTVSQTDTVSLS